MTPKLTVATSFPIFPTLGGGQARVLGLYGALARQGVAVDVVSLASRQERFGIRELAPGYRQITIPKTPEHDHAEFKLQTALGLPVTDISLMLHHELTPEYAKALRESAADASAVVACHPFGFPALTTAAPGLPLIYEAQDVETDLKRDLLSAADTNLTAEIIEAVHDCEAHVSRAAELVLTCSEIDSTRLIELFELDPARLVEVPNGCELGEIPFVGPKDRDAHRSSVGVDAFTVLFVGSWHGPNIDAVRAVCDAAGTMPDTRFLVVGGAGLAVADDSAPPNVDLAGPVARGFLRDVLALASVAVNPVNSGSGTNLKMLEYAAAGVPLISSSFGARGLGFVAGEHYATGEPATLAAALASVRDEPNDQTTRRVGLAYDRVAAAFDWSVIGHRWLQSAAMQKIVVTQ